MACRPAGAAGSRKELTRRSDELARQRQELPWVRIDKEYRFDTNQGTASLVDLFQGRPQLLVYHFMFGPGYTAGCPTCSSIADAFVVHLAHTTSRCARCRGPRWTNCRPTSGGGLELSWASSYGSDFNYDFHVSHTEQEWQVGAVEHNFRTMDFQPPAGQDNPFIAALTSAVGTDWETYRREGPGMSAFALDGGVVYHTYSAYERGIDILWGMYPWLDHAPLVRNETGL